LLYKASKVNKTSRARKLRKPTLRPRVAWFLAIHQLTKLNQGKKAANTDGKGLEKIKQFSVMRGVYHKIIKATPRKLTEEFNFLRESFKTKPKEKFVGYSSKGHYKSLIQKVKKLALVIKGG
jgi:N-terminal domain of reverse transcriptase